MRPVDPGVLLSGSVAQLVERSTENRKVTGSTPVGATNPRFGHYPLQISGSLVACPHELTKLS